MIKKPLAIILAFFIVFSPVYSYAVLPALVAAAASSTGRVLVGNAIKRVGQAALSKAGMVSMAAGVGYMASTKSAIEQDGWTVGGGGAGGEWEDANGNINMEIYKMPPSGCQLVVRFGANRLTPDDFYNDFKSRLYKGADHPDGLPRLKSIHDRLLIEQANYKSMDWRAESTTTIYAYYDYRDSATSPYYQRTTSISTQAFVRCEPYPTNKIYITENEFNAYLTKNITVDVAGDNIKNIYNYDYSQHPNVTINNNTTGGSDINNDLSISADPELNVTPRLRLDIESNKVNLDNVNDTNCTKTPEGAYDNCTGEPDPEEETDPDDPNNPSPEEPPPIECTANGFYQKICDWMDWTKQPHTEPTSTNVVVTDKSSEIVIDDSRINFDDQCPTPKDIDITVAGHSFSDALDYQPLCDFFTKLHPFVVGMGGISSALIIAGGVRRG